MASEGGTGNNPLTAPTGDSYLVCALSNPSGLSLVVDVVWVVSEIGDRPMVCLIHPQTFPTILSLTVG